MMSGTFGATEGDIHERCLPCHETRQAAHQAMAVSWCARQLLQIWLCVHCADVMSDPQRHMPVHPSAGASSAGEQTLNPKKSNKRTCARRPGRLEDGISDRPCRVPGCMRVPEERVR